MPWSKAEITERYPVWDVLSEFWLDGWLDDLDCDRIAARLKASPYSKEQLWKICIYEVAPAVSSNLLSIAGVWGGFEAEWLRTMIIKKSPNSNDYLKPGTWRKFRGLMHGSLVRSSGWNKIVKKL
jgi:hypothetical protein